MSALMKIVLAMMVAKAVLAPVPMAVAATMTPTTLAAFETVSPETGVLRGCKGPTGRLVPCKPARPKY
ncbi:MAG: hypothetical protein IAE87_15395 [Rhodobacteraceae bacterium]|nr:hypothetical protein [Paracoccaceae bacterium]